MREEEERDADANGRSEKPSSTWTYDPLSRESILHRFVFSHALANSVKVELYDCLKLNLIISLFTGGRDGGEIVATSGEHSLIAVNKALSTGALLIDKRTALITLAKFTQKVT